MAGISWKSNYQLSSELNKRAAGEQTDDTLLIPAQDVQCDLDVFVALASAEHAGVAMSVSDDVNAITALGIPTDPMLAQQWHLGNSVPGLLDLNVRKVWNDYTGGGIRVVVIDNGFDYLHVDLVGNYDQGLDYDFAEADLDPFGTSTDSHGTAVAGIIGADDNGTGVVGVAFDSSLVGYRTYGFINDFWLQNIRDAIHHAALSAQGDVANISQGIANDANSEFGIGYNAARFDEIETSIGEAVGQGRGGLGMIIVKSAGNSRSDNYDVNADDWTNDTRQVVVAAVDQNGFVSSYSSYGAAVLISGFGTPGQVVTTDRTGAAGYNSTDYTSGFNGTSAAAPMVSGVVALILDANPSLGWRDVQTILAYSARHVGTDIGAGISGSERYPWGWNGAHTWNGGGLHFSNDYGYGLVDALAAVRLAETWLDSSSPAQTNGNQFTNTMDVLNAATVIPDGNATGLSFSGTAGFNDQVERVTVQMTFSTTFTADMDVYLTSPSGTVSELIADNGGSSDFSGTWTFESQAFRGERAAGTWTVRVVDDTGADVLTVSDIVIRTWGRDSANDRYVYTNEYATYAGLGGHNTTLSDTNGGTDTLNAAAVSGNSVINLNEGAASTIAGQALTIAVGTQIENAYGGDGNDLLIGNGSANLLHGGRGNDRLEGGNGTDSLFGEAGDDTLSQGFGGPDEILDGGAGNDTGDWSYSNFDQWVINLAAGTAMIGSAVYAHLTSIENVIGGQSNDKITGDGSGNRLDGQGGNDILDGGNGTDSLYGGAGNDTLIQNFGGPNEIMDGGSGNDTGDWSYSTTDQWVINLVAGTAKIGATVFAQLISIENVVGGQMADQIIGNGGANLLEGGGGSDRLDGGAGNDTLIGDAGDDTFVVDRANDVVKEKVGEGSDRVLTSVSYALAAGQEIELLQTTNSALTTPLMLTGNELANTIIGNAGANVLNGGSAADTLSGLGGDDTYYVDSPADVVNEDANPAVGGTNDRVLTTGNYKLKAGSGVEVLQTINNALITPLSLTGNEFNNTILGNAGVNLLDGGAGVDALFGFGGNDTYYVDSAADVVNEDANQAVGGTNDRVLTVGNYALKIGSGIETLQTVNSALTTAVSLTGNEFANTIIGNAGNNVLDGGGNADTMFGLGGNDTYYVDHNLDIVNENANAAIGGSNDRVLTKVNYALKAGSGVETLQTADSSLTTALILGGNELVNTIIGNAGANTLNGGAGKDTLFGLGGADKFLFNTALNTAPGTAFSALPGSANVDYISDYNPAADTIQLEDGIFAALAATPVGPGGVRVLAVGAFNIGAAASQADDRIIYNATNGALIYDSDGSGVGAAFQFAVLKTNLAVTNADFWVV